MSRRILVEPIDMPPELLVAVLAFHRPARLPLLLGDALEVAVAVGVQAMIAYELCLDDLSMLSDRNHRQVFDIEIDADRHQVGVVLALHYLLGCDLLHLRNMEFCRVGSQDERRALPLPARFPESLYEVASGVDRVSHPAPSLAGVDIDAHKGLLEIERLQIKRDAPLIERGMIAGRWKTRLALLFTACFPVRVIGEIGAHLANRIFDHRAAVGKGHPWKALGKVPTC